MPSKYSRNSGFIPPQAMVLSESAYFIKSNSSKRLSIMYVKIILGLISFIFILQAIVIQAEETNKPIEILSDTLKYYPQEKKAVFEGRVDATQDDLKILCDKMTAYLKDEESNELKDNNRKSEKDITTGKIERIEVAGNVVITTLSDKAESERGEYYVHSGMLYLYGNVKLYQNENQLFGDKLIYNKRTGESLVTSVKKNNRVRGVFKQEAKHEG